MKLSIGSFAGLTAVAALMLLSFASAASAAPPQTEQKQPQPVQPTPPPPGQAGGVQPGGHVGQPIQMTVAPPPGSALAIGQEHGKITGPGIALDTPNYDFGKVMGGNDIRHDYWFTNIGTANLEIINVRPSCGCTTAGEYDHVVEPGHSGRIPIKIATGHMSGRISKTINLATNAAENPNTVLRVEGELWQPVQVTPANIAWGVLDGDALTKPLTKEAIIDNNMSEMLEILSVDSQSPMFRAEVKPMVPGKKFKLSVTSIPPFPPGSIMTNIKLKTNMPGASEIMVQAFAYVPPALQIRPAQLYLRPKQSSAYAQTIQLVSSARTNFKVSNLRCADPKLEASIQPRAGTTGYDVIVKIPADYQLPGTGAVIQMDTDLPVFKTITIPVTQPGAPMATPMTPRMGSLGTKVQQRPVTPPAPAKPAGGAGH